ncbi:MAG: arylesterase [Gemmatimonadetes bacterium]|nr:arylesterase [Gemmatimonadota bacterium]MBK6841525.1 arylesterase [Gemmatimonadota bacterium]
MRVLLSIVALASVAVLGCSGTDAGKDTARDTSVPAQRDERADAMSGAAAVGEDSAASSGAPTMLIVGTSLTAGLGLDPAEAYPAVLQRMADSAGYGVRIVNAGLSGETSAGALRRLEWLLREPAAVVMIETGANDGLRGLDVDSTRANLVAIVRLVKRALPAASVLLVQMEAPPNLGADYTRRFHDSYGAVAAAEGATLLPFLLEGVAGVRKLNQGDGIHPTVEGAKRVAGNVWPALGPILSRLAKPGMTG